MERISHRFHLLLLISLMVYGGVGASLLRAQDVPEPQYRLTQDQTHNRFSSAIPPVLRVPSGAVIEAYTKEASDGQLTLESTIDDVANLDFDPIHPLTGPVYVEGAEPGDILAVTLHRIELGDYGWTAAIPGFGFLADECEEPYLKTFAFEEGQAVVRFGKASCFRCGLFRASSTCGPAPRRSSRTSRREPTAGI